MFGVLNGYFDKKHAVWEFVMAICRYEKERIVSNENNN